MNASHYKFFFGLLVVSAGAAWLSWWLFAVWVVLVALFLDWAHMGSEASPHDVAQTPSSANDNEKNASDVVEIEPIIKPQIEPQIKPQQTDVVHRVGTFKNERTWARSLGVSNDGFSAQAKDLLLTHRANDGSEGRAESVALMRSNFAQHEFLRSIEIIAESCWLVLAGKKQATIDSRMGLIAEHVDRLDFSLVNEKTKNFILTYTEQVHERWKTSRFLNEAIDMVAKANKLKTANARKKRLDAAREMLHAGLAAYPENTAFQKALSLIPEHDIETIDLVVLSEEMRPED